MAPNWRPTEDARDEGERRDAVFRLRLWTWLARKNGRSALPRRRRRRPFRYVVLCKRCWRVVMMPTNVGPPEHDRMRLHLNLHGRFFTPTADDLLPHFELKSRTSR
jgi:hypothetical protein